jgi:deoxyribose-phosphate aldolase
MQNMTSYIEQTLLSPVLKERDLEKLAEEAAEYSFFGVCVPPYWVKKMKNLLKNETKIVTVIGFPLGYNRTEAKLREAELCIADGADELDMVMNQTAFSANPHAWVKTEIARLAELSHQNEKVLKVIIETAYLDRVGMELACKICVEAGADFVKTSTGFAPKGADADDIAFMRALLPAAVGIKASGGIRDYETAKKMIEAGATRIGTSSGVQILKGVGIGTGY